MNRGYQGNGRPNRNQYSYNNQYRYNSDYSKRYYEEPGRNTYSYEQYVYNAASVKPRKKVSSAKIIVCTIASILLVAVNVVSILGFGMLGKMNTVTQEDVEANRVTGEELEELDNEFAESSTDIVSETELELPKDYIISTEDVSLFLLIGSDSRFGISDEARSDSMMIVAIDRVHKKIKLVSILRDLYAIIPNYKNDRFNTAFYYDSRYGNLDLKITFATIKKNFGVDIEDYVVIDFGGFRKVIDTLGGVTVEVTKKEAEYMCSHEKYGLFPRFEAGEGVYTMNGAETLNYCRMRKVGNGDFGRTARQRKVISELVNQLKGSSVNTLYDIAEECMGSVVTNIPQKEILGYAMEAAEILGYEIVQMQLPIEGSYVQSRVYKGTTPMSVLWPNYNWNAKQLKKFIFDDDMSYISGKKAKNVTIPFLPAGTVKSLESETTETTTTATSVTSTESTTTTTEAGATTSTTTSATTATTTTASTTATTAASTATTAATTATEASE